MRLAAGANDPQRNAVLSKSGVVYTPKDALAGSTNGKGDTTAQDSSNAAV